MPKFGVGDWVRDGNGKRGRVCCLRGRSAMVRWVGSHKSTRHGTRSLRLSDPPRALVLEGSLDACLSSIRSEEDLLRSWLRATNVDLAYKNVHALDDITVLARAMGRNRPPFVHISCHGSHDKEKRARIYFAPGRGRSILLNDPETQRVFREAFEDLPVFFSTCLLGRYQSEMKKFRKAAKLGPIAAFTRSVFDCESMLFALLLYHGVMTVGWNFTTAVSKARRALHGLGVRGPSGAEEGFVRVF